MTPPATKTNGSGLVQRRCLGALVLALAIGLAGTGPTRAVPFRKDAVEEFKQALKLESTKDYRYKERLTDASLKLALAFREKNLTRAARNLKTLPDLSRALLLQEWPDLPKKDEKGNRIDLPLYDYDRRAQEIERRIRAEMTARFVEGVAEGLAKAPPVRQVALCNLVAETVAASDQLPELGLESDLSRLVAPLVKLMKTTTSDAVKIAAARALGVYPRQADKVAGAFAFILDHPEDSSTAARLAVAEGLGALVQALAGEENIKASEPGVTYRPAPRGLGNRPANYARTLADVAVAITPVGMSGTSDSSPLVRRACISAVRRTISELGVYVNELTRFLVDFGLGGLPPGEREWTPLERQLMQEARQRYNKDTDPVRPALAAFAKPEMLKGLLRTVRDEDPATRLEARRTMEELARLRRFVREFQNALPTEGSKTPDTGKKLPRPPIEKLPRPGKTSRLDPRSTAKKARIILVAGTSTAKPPPLPRLRVAPPTLPDEVDMIGRELVEVGDAIVQQGVSDARPVVRRATMEAIEALGRDGAKYMPQLLRGLKDRDLFVRWICARALGNLAEKRSKLYRAVDAQKVVPALSGVLDDQDLDPRTAATVALGQYGGDAKGAVPALTEHLSKGDAEFRIAVMKALEAIGTDSAPALPALVKSFSDIDPRVRAAAATLVGKFGPAAKAYLPNLQRLASDLDTTVRAAATNAIVEITPEK